MRSRLAAGVPLAVGLRADTPVVGIEHEYRVLAGDRQVDFAAVLHGLPVDGVRLDPSDANAYRTASGALVTADGREAEVATAPVSLRPGCTVEVEWRAFVAREQLRAVLPPALLLDGYSTHLNVEVDDAAV